MRYSMYLTLDLHLDHLASLREHCSRDPGAARNVAIFRETRNGVRPISGAKNQATAMAFGGPRSSCVRPGAHSARRQDFHNDLTPCRMALHFVSAGAHAPHSDETPGPYGYAGNVALRSSLTLHRFPVLLRRRANSEPDLVPHQC